LDIQISAPPLQSKSQQPTFAGNQYSHPATPQEAVIRLAQTYQGNNAVS